MGLTMLMSRHKRGLCESASVLSFFLCVYVSECRLNAIVSSARIHICVFVSKRNWNKNQCGLTFGSFLCLLNEPRGWPPAMTSNVKIIKYKIYFNE